MNDVYSEIDTCLVSYTKISGIYKITNNVNGKVYIGESLDIKRRWSEEHIPQLLQNEHGNKALQKDFNEYGLDSFNFEVLQRFESTTPVDTKVRLILLENYYMCIYENSGIELYNVENTLKEVLSGNKKVIDGNSFVLIMVRVLAEEEIKLCEGIPYFSRYNTLRNILFTYVKPKSGETKSGLLNLFKEYLVKNKVNMSEMVEVKMFHYVMLNGKKEECKIEVILEKYVEEMKKHAIIFDYTRNVEGIIKNSDLKSEVRPRNKDSKEIAFSSLFKEFSNTGLIPEEYDYSKIRKFLEEKGIIQVIDVVDKDENVKKVTYSTEKSLDDNILRIVRQKKVCDTIVYNYVFTENGIREVTSLFESIDKKERYKMFEKAS